MRDIKISVRLSPAEHEWLAEAAQIEGRTVGQYVRMRALVGFGAVMDELDEAVEPIKKVMDDLEALEKPLPKKKSTKSGVCERHARMKITKPIRGCPNCKVMKSVDEQFDVDSLESK